MGQPSHTELVDSTAQQPILDALEGREIAVSYLGGDVDEGALGKRFLCKRGRVEMHLSFVVDSKCPEYSFVLISDLTWKSLWPWREGARLYDDVMEVVAAHDAWERFKGR